MQARKNSTHVWKRIPAIALLVVLSFGFTAVDLTTEALASEKTTQIAFDTPAAAGAALEQAAKDDDEIALSGMLGVDTATLLSSGTKEQDKADLQAFAAKFNQMNRWVDMSDGSRVLYIGADNFAFPVPLAQDSSGRWYFDGIAGAQEIRARDIGRNELLAMDACYALANAEQVYFAMHGDAPVYARRIISTKGMRDGLYWPASASNAPSPLAALDDFAKSTLTSASPNRPFVMDGYSFRILTAQGDDAPGGARSYMTNGKLTEGFAVLATPVKYAEAGIMTFMVGPNGTIYEQDFGPDTATIVGSIRACNPSENWSPVD
jgi:hypothetical protein